MYLICAPTHFRGLNLTRSLQVRVSMLSAQLRAALLLCTLQRIHINCYEPGVHVSTDISLHNISCPVFVSASFGNQSHKYVNIQRQ